MKLFVGAAVKSVNNTLKLNDSLRVTTQNEVTYSHDHVALPVPSYKRREFERQ